MKHYAIKGKPTRINWTFHSIAGEEFSLAGHSYRLYYSNGTSRGLATGVTHVGNVLTWDFVPGMQWKNGFYDIAVEIYSSGLKLVTVTYPQAFLLIQNVNDALTLVLDENDEFETINSASQDDVATLNILSYCDFNRFVPLAPVIGSDGKWYINGQPVLDDNDNPVYADSTIDIEEDGTIVVNKNRHNEYTITSLKTALELAAADHSTAVTDHTTAASDHSTAASDHTTAASDHSRATDDHIAAVSDHATAESDHDIALDNNTLAAADHAVAQADHATATSDHNTASADHSTAVGDHNTSVADQALALQDHNRAESDHTTAAADHTAATTAATTAASDHATAQADHTTAASDHSTAAADHLAASSDHTTATSDHGTAVLDHSTAVADHEAIDGALAEIPVTYVSAKAEQEFSSSEQALARTNIDAQAKLISGTNIKTINNQSILGEGNITVTAGDTNAVKYVEQSLTSEQQAQARTNIGAGTYSKPSGGIPSTDIASGVIPDVSNFITKSVNDLTNYYLKTETYTQTEVNSLIGAISQFHYEIAASTSAVTNPQSNVLYLIGPTGSGADKYEEYVYPDSTTGWVKIGDTSIDLSGYVTTSALNTALADYTTTTDLTTLLGGKADKVTSATSGNFAGLDSNGNLVDSGHKHSDYLTSHQDISGKEDTSNKVSSWSSTTTDTHYPSEKLVKDSLDAKQAALVSGTNIKTINNESLLGSGNITIQGGDPNAVLFTAQTLTDAQKLQARTNIGAGTGNYSYTDLGEIDAEDYDYDVGEFLNTLQTTGGYTFLFEEMRYCVEVESLESDYTTIIGQVYWGTEEGALMRMYRSIVIIDGDIDDVSEGNYITFQEASSVFAFKSHTHWSTVSGTTTVWAYLDSITSADNNVFRIIYRDTDDDGWLVESCQTFFSPIVILQRVTKIGDASVIYQRYGTRSGINIVWNAWIEFRPQIQSDWSQSVSTERDYIKNKPTIPTITLNGSSTTSASIYAPTSTGTSGQVLTWPSSGSVPTWSAVPTEVYWCTYGTTTQSAITTAVTAGKLPACKYGDNLYVYAGESSAGYSQFTSILYNTASRIYVKNSTWGNGSFTIADSSSVHSIPSGGTTGQVLKKSSGTDYAVEWANESGGGSGTVTDVTVGGTSVVDGNGVAVITSEAVTETTLATVATTGAYSDLSGTPTIPDAVEANPTVPSGTTPTALTGLKIGTSYYDIEAGGGTVTDVTVGGTSVVDGSGVAVIPAIPTVPVTDVTVGGSSVVSNGTAAVPAIPDAVTANPTVPSGTTPTALTGLKIGSSSYYSIAASATPMTNSEIDSAVNSAWV